MLPIDKQERKELPIARGVLDYFPDAIAEIARVSLVGNQQHNPGEEMRWDRSGSNDHSDCIARHLIERGTIDADGLRHSAKVAWRALALLQVELESAKVIPMVGQCCNHTATDRQRKVVTLQNADGIRAVEAAVNSIRENGEESRIRRRDYLTLVISGCNPLVATNIASAIRYCRSHEFAPYVYISGPMTDLPAKNHPAFDKARDYLLHRGFNVISPADIDRESDQGQTELPVSTYVYRDFQALYFLGNMDEHFACIYPLPGRENSIGSMAEIALARWLRIDILPESY